MSLLFKTDIKEGENINNKVETKCQETRKLCSLKSQDVHKKQNASTI